MPPKQPTRREFGKTLRRIRTEQGLSMGDLADKSGLTVVAVSDLERGRLGDITAVRPYVGALTMSSHARMVLMAAADMAWKYDDEE